MVVSEHMLFDWSTSYKYYSSDISIDTGKLICTVGSLLWSLSSSFILRMEIPIPMKENIFVNWKNFDNKGREPIIILNITMAIGVDQT